MRAEGGGWAGVLESEGVKLYANDSQCVYLTDGQWRKTSNSRVLFPFFHTRGRVKSLPQDHFRVTSVTTQAEHDCGLACKDWRLRQQNQVLSSALDAVITVANVLNSSFLVPTASANRPRERVCYVCTDYFNCADY